LLTVLFWSASAGSGRVVVAEADGPSGASLPGSARAPDVADPVWRSSEPVSSS